MNEKIKTFYEDLDPFFKEEMLVELYQTDKLCICDLGLFTYIVFAYIRDPASGKQVGVMVSLEVVKRIISRGDDDFFRLLRGCSKKNVTRRSIIFDEKAYALARELIEKRKKDGVPSNIDPALNNALRQDFLRKKAKK